MASVVLNGHTYDSSQFTEYGYQQTLYGDTLFPNAIFTDMLAQLASATSVQGVSPGTAGNLLISTGSAWTTTSAASTTRALLPAGAAIGSPASTTGAATGDTVYANAKAIRFTNTAGNSTLRALLVDASNILQLGQDVASINVPVVIAVTALATFRATGKIVNFLGSNGSNAYLGFDNTPTSGGKKWRLGYSGGTGSSVTTFDILNETDNISAFILSSAGALTLASSLTATGATFTGGNAAITLSGSGTTRAFVAFSNTGGSASIGIESVGGGNIFAGSTAYATVFGSANSTPLQLFSNGTLALTFSTSQVATFSAGFTTSLSTAHFGGGRLRVGNSASATIGVGAIADKFEVFDAAGASLGYVPIYATIT